MATHPWQLPSVVDHTRLLLDSFECRLGRPLMARSGSAARDAELLFLAPFVVVSHGLEDDPVLNYGNRVALELWETDWDGLTRLPSRLTAEPMNRSERQVMLERAARVGYIDDYAGVRISTSGRRFRIDQAIIWNLADADGRPRGQAATFGHWQML